MIKYTITTMVSNKKDTITIDDLIKIEERRKRWAEHCNTISEKTKLNEIRKHISEEYAKHRYCL